MAAANVRAKCLKLRGVPCWFTGLEAGHEDQRPQRRIELTTLWKHLTGQRGDKALASLLRRSGHAGPPCTVPEGAAGLGVQPFPGQRGHKSDKRMPCADAEGLLWLMAETDDAFLETHRDLLVDIVAHLGGDAQVARAVRSRYPSLAMIENDTSLVHMVLRQDDVPRVALYSLLKAFSPARNPAELFLHRGVAKYLQQLDVSMPGNLSFDVAFATSEDKFQEAPSVDDTLQRAFDHESILPYERQLAAKSQGLIHAPCAYNNGTPVLLADFPVVVLVLFRLKTAEARSLQLGNFHQGLVLMGGNDDVAVAMSQHWKAERDAKPSNQFLQFLGLAVEHEAAAASAPKGDDESGQSLRRAREEDELDELQHRKKRRELELASLAANFQASQQKVALELEILKQAAETKGELDRRAAEEALARELEIKQLRRQEAQEALQAAEERRRLQNLMMAAELVEQHGQLFSMSEADRVAHADLLRSATRARSVHPPEPERGAAISLEIYLSEKGLSRSEAVKQRSSFGRMVLEAWQQEHPGERPPKKSIFCNGQEISANCYYEADRPVLDAVFEANRSKLLPPPAAPAVPTAGFIRSFFRSAAASSS